MLPPPQVYRQTGLDVDGRERILRVYADCMELQIRGFVHFAQGVPGFRSLPLADQADLLKAARAELLILGVYRGYVHEYKTFVNPVGMCFIRKESVSALGPDLPRVQFAVASKLRRLDVLSQGELVLLKAICLTFSDRCQLRAKEKVDEVQWRLLCAFLKSLRANHGGGGRGGGGGGEGGGGGGGKEDSLRFSDVIDCLVALRTLTEVSRKAHDSTPLTAAFHRNHPVLVEVFMLH